VEAKDVGFHLDSPEDSEQLKRYRGSLRNLILTDSLEFRLYRNGDAAETVQLAKLSKDGTLRRIVDTESLPGRFIDAFFDARAPSIANPRELAERRATMSQKPSLSQSPHSVRQL